jgi:hypothetical protein
MQLFENFLSGMRAYMEKENLRILVRLHPREDINAFQKITEGNFYENKVFFVQQYALFACLAVVDLSVILASTVGLESMLCDTPVAVIKLPDHGFVFNYVSSGCAIGIDLNADFSPAIWSAITAQREELVKKCRVYVSDQLSNSGRSADYISSHIADLLNVD